MQWLEYPTDPVVLSQNRDAPEQVHVFDEDSVNAVNAALAARRPLLVRGEPGVGKTQLAAATACKLCRAFVSLTVDSRTESRDLLWKFDAVRRLAQAQLVGHVANLAPAALEELDVAKFVAPGPLWWAFNWKSAMHQAKASSAPIPETDGAVKLDADKVPMNGCVVLIDEIDKGETDVPNGLLEALGSSSIPRFGSTERIHVAGTAPLVIVTTNAERTLPDAFLRRCLLLHLKVPEKAEIVTWLVKRGRAHFPKVSEDVLQSAAEMLCEDRENAVPGGPRPGQAEFLDIVRAVLELAPDSPAQQQQILKTVRRYVLQKHVDKQA